MRFGSLFAGIGGFDLGLERAGMVCSWQVEINKFCIQVLKKHWPNVRRMEDVRIFPPKPRREWQVDLIVGGFPCQDISLAGKGEGLKGKNSSLWKEFVRVVCLLRPTYAVMENTANLHNKGLPSILGEMAELGYDAEWAVLPATAVGAPHIRPRQFIVAHTNRERSNRVYEWEQKRCLAANPVICCKNVPDRTPTENPSGIFAKVLPWCENSSAQVGVGQWGIEPQVGRVVDGVSSRVVRPQYSALGNAVVPQLAEFIGRAIVERHSQVMESNRL